MKLRSRLVTLRKNNIPYIIENYDKLSSYIKYINYYDIDDIIVESRNFNSDTLFGGKKKQRSNKNVNYIKIKHIKTKIKHIKIKIKRIKTKQNQPNSHMLIRKLDNINFLLMLVVVFVWTCLKNFSVVLTSSNIFLVLYFFSMNLQYSF